MKPFQFIDPSYPQVWHAPAEGEAPQGYQLLTLAGWLAARDTWPRGLPVGVQLANDEAVEQLAPDLARIGLVTLAFPKWTDGRAYSQARLLRSRWRYEGEVRATGEVLIDMLPLLERTGFTSAELRADQDRLAAERALRFFPGHYQGDALGHRPQHWKAAA
jgi:uncharacterized protein (DUF934 family)